MYELTELQEKWLKALESGEYKQGQFALYRNGSYCCLGVACAVAGAQFDERGNADGENAWLSPRLVGVFGLRSHHGAAHRSFSLGAAPRLMSVRSLMEANDKEVPFAEIAAAIRANPENFFLPADEAQRTTP
jgi:hypothetical protein